MNFNRPDVVEFYANDRVLVRIESSVVPLPGQWISIHKIAYKVVGVGYCIDHAESIHDRQMRVNVELEKV